jgi:phosphatidylinositol-4,5-bisphosphate 3-kinase
MAYVMGGKGSDDFEKFQDFCTKAYNLIRENGNHLISLFIMMIIAGN